MHPLKKIHALDLTVIIDTSINFSTKKSIMFALVRINEIDLPEPCISV